MNKLRLILGILALVACGYSFPGDVQAAPREHVYQAADKTYPLLMGAYRNLSYCREYQGPAACAGAAQNLVRKSVWAKTRMINADTRGRACAAQYRARWLGIPDNMKLAAANYRRPYVFSNYVQAAGRALRESMDIRRFCIVRL